MKKITFFFVAMFFALAAFADIASGTKLYFNPGLAGEGWASSGVTYSVKFSKASTGGTIGGTIGGAGTSSNPEVNMTLTEDGVTYVVEAPAGGPWQNAITFIAKVANETSQRVCKTTYDGTNDCFTLTSITNNGFEGAWSVYVAPAAPAITASWSMAEGAQVEVFEEVSITFTGVESADLKSMYTACLYKVNEDNTIAIAESNCGSGGILDRVATGATIKLSIFDEYGDDYCWEGKLPAGNYRIVLAPGTVKFNGDKDNLNTEEYSLNFTITKGNVIPPVDVTVVATPANNSTIKEFTSVEVTFSDYPMIQSRFQPMGNPQPDTWPFLWLTRNGELVQPVLPLNMMQTNANVVTVSVIASMNEDKESWSTEGEYAVVIPEKLIMVSASEHASRVVLNYTIEAAKPAGVTATWSIEEGAEVESFTSVDVTFSGVDTLGRVLGEEVQRATVLAYGESFFYSVDEEGNKTPVVTDKNEYGQPGIMSSTYDDDLTQTLSLSSDDYKFYEGAFVKNGKYCIVIPAGAVKFRIDDDDETDVRNAEEFVLNFTIKNDIVMPEAVEAAFKVTPDTAATNKVESLTEVIVEFTEYESITIKETADDGFSTYAECGVYEEFESFYGEIFTEWMSKATMLWSAVEGKPNALRLYVDAEWNQGDTVLVTPNTYIVRIPAGVAYFTDTKFNETLELRITVDNEAIEVTKVEEVEANPYKRLLYKGLELEVKTITPDPENPDYTIDQTFIAGTNIPVSGLGQIVPLKLDVYAIYKSNFDEYGTGTPTPTLVIEEVVAVQKFNLFSDMISYLEGATDAEKALSYEVAEEVVVSFVNPRGGCVYLQYGVMIQDGWDMIESSRGVKAQYSGTDLAVGDKVTVKGKYQPMVAVTDDWGEVESIEATAEFVAETITKVASKQAIPAYEVAENVIIGGDIAGTYVALADGKVVEKDDAYYYERVRTEEVYNEETYDWDVVDVIDSLALINVGNIDELVKETEEPLYAIVEFDVVAQAVQIWAIGYGDYYTPEVETAVENAEVANIYTENGMIVAEGEFAIYTITGQNVTEMNGRLAAGIYVVRTANATAKVVVK